MRPVHEQETNEKKSPATPAASPKKKPAKPKEEVILRDKDGYIIKKDRGFSTFGSTDEQQQTDPNAPAEMDEEKM